MIDLGQRLEALFERGHIVLVFLQFVAMLDVIEVSVPTLIRNIFSWTMGMTGLSAQVQTLVIMPHRRFDGPIGTLCGDGPFPTRRRQARRPTALPSEHSYAWARHQPHP